MGRNENNVAARIMRQTADWLATNPISYESLASGPLGEALTRSELLALADDQAAIDHLIERCRDNASWLEAAGEPGNHPDV